MPIYFIMFLVSLGGGALAALLGASLLAMAIRRRQSSGPALFCAVPGVAFLGVAVVALRFAVHVTHIKLPPGG